MNPRNEIKVSGAGAGGARASEYALPVDFCGVFRDEMSSLYGLALLLTGGHAAAEQAFAAALDECMSGGRVFKDWTGTWAKRAIIKSAIRTVRPRAGTHDAASVASPGELHPVFRPLMQLSTFDRFCYVMTVLHRYRERECAALLDCGAQEIRGALDRAYQAFRKSGSWILAGTQAHAALPAARLSVA